MPRELSDVLFEVLELLPEDPPHPEMIPDFAVIRLLDFPESEIRSALSLCEKRGWAEVGGNEWWRTVEGSEAWRLEKERRASTD